ncbi:AcrR family transcriptional regulator [Streptacidiphilus sp. BW17]|uniref:TetR/AcrR family transcriptional regulator n=1 Tax=Streptacidiphilus sp. BW17 TaxID=3156274 RepID=UPI0035160C31
MSLQERREREQVQRRRLIISTARELAEAEGWGAVTTRRLAQQIEWSQPVLYKHFKAKEDIVQAVALEGFDELAEALGEACRTEATPAAGLRGLAQAYLRFATDNPTVYEAMFTLPVGLDFGVVDTPEPLVAAFAELREAIAPLAGDRDLDSLAELLWGALHGLVALAHSGRLRPGHEVTRLQLLVDQLSADADDLAQR